MITLDILNRWLLSAPENEHLEFKEAKQQYDTTKLLRYCVALANEGGGHLVLGVSDQRPRHVVGTQAFLNSGDIKARILEALRIRADVQELTHPDGRVLVFSIPPRPMGTPLHHEGAYAVGFQSLVDFVHSSAPLNHFVEQVVREEVKMFPRQAIRELVANALVHQDFEATGQSVMVEM